MTVSSIWKQCPCLVLKSSALGQYIFIMYCHNCSHIAIKGRQHIERGECWGFFAINLELGINVCSCLLYYQDLMTESSIFTSLLENYIMSCP